MSMITLVNLSYGFKGHGNQDRLLPLGSLHLVSALEEKGYDVDFKDYQINAMDRSFNTGALATFLGNSGDVLGVSCCSDSLPLILAALKKMKEGSPNKLIILGGIGPTGVAEEILKNFSFIDVIVKGEGEITIVEVMDQIQSNHCDLAGVKGIAYREKEEIHLNPPRKRIKYLDKLPLPAYHKINLMDYTSLGVISARGCPYSCTFCDAASFWDYRVIRRDVEKVIQELKAFHSHYPGRIVHFYDEIFTLDKKRVLRFCRRLKEENLDIRWSAMTQIDLIDKELMREMSASGCQMVLYGIDSGSDLILQKMGKKYNTREAKDKILRSLDYFQVQTLLIWGFPFETMPDFYETMEFAAYVSEIGAMPLVYLLAPFSLSPIYNQYKDTLKFSRELYDACHLIQNEDVIGLIEKYPKIFPGFCYYEEGNVLEKYPIAKGYESIPFLA